jgi:hypothetical protein
VAKADYADAARPMPKALRRQLEATLALVDAA